MDMDQQPAETAQDLVALIATTVRREREKVGLSLTELARRAGIAKSTLSQLEAGNANPGVETLWALSVALGVPFSRLVDPPRQGPQVIRVGQGPSVRAELADYAAVHLSTNPAGARRDIYRLEVQPGRIRTSAAHSPGTVEHMILTSGRARIGPVTAPVELAPGDYVTYTAATPLHSR